MDTLSRLIFLLALFFAGNAFGFTYTVTSHGFTGTGPSIDSASASWESQYDAAAKPACIANGVTVAYWGVDRGQVNYSAKTFAITITRYYQSNVAHSCGESSIPDNIPFTVSGQNTCMNGDQLVDPATCQTCQQGQVKDASGNCVDQCSQPPLSTLKIANSSDSKLVNVCIGSCSYDLAIVVTPSGNSSYYAPSGKKCSGSEAGTASAGQSPASAPADEQCAKGMCRANGVINGQTINKCVACNVVETSSDKNTSTSTSASGPAGSSSSTDSTSVTEKTVCKDGQCTTTKTVNYTDGQGNTKEASETTTQGKNDFCASKPSDPACKGTDSSWGGACASGFSCDGDAVACAIAQASWKSACATEIDPNDSKVSQGNAAMQAGLRPSDHPGLNVTSTAFPGSLNQTNPYGGSCPPDFTLNAYGKSVVVPLSDACGMLTLLGRVAVAISLLAAARIMFGDMKG